MYKILPLLFLLGSAAAADRPNIVLIMSDDMGFSDIGCYGSEIETPHLDSLADGGLRFTQFYNTARCCPTRASLLTGLYPHQAGIGWMMNDNGHDGYRGELNRTCVTIAEALGANGYRAYMAGKWHVTKATSPKTDDDKHNWPIQRGFDRFYGTIHGAGSFFDPNTLTRDNTYISPVTDPEYQPETYFYTDAISDHAVRFITEHKQQSPDKPFFTYVSYTAAHWPMHALPKDIAKYDGKYDAGYEPTRAARYKKMLELGLIEPSAALSPLGASWTDVTEKEWEAANQEVYAAMVDNMDQGIGRIIEALKKTGQYDNTLILFLQDNGGCAEGMGRGGNGKPRAAKPTLPALADDYLQPDMIPKQTRDGYPMRQGSGVMPGPADTYIGYGRNWATVSNTPFREYKHWVHEGGISTPLIAHWPTGLKAELHGKLDHQPGHLIDIMATCIDIAGADYPDGNIKPMEGVSLAPAFSSKPLNRTAPIFWEHEGNRAIRQGDWKLVAKNRQPWELYNIADDRSELNNLISRHAHLANDLATRWDRWAERANVLPLTPYYRNRTQKKPSKKSAFVDLPKGTVLDNADNPATGNRTINITTTIDSPAPGVLVAQGGVAHGFALYINQKLQPAFALRIGGELHTFVAASPLPTEKATLHLDLRRGGKLTLTSNSKTVLTAKAPSSLTANPADSLSVGLDSNDPVGDYPREFPFPNKLEKTSITIK